MRYLVVRSIFLLFAVCCFALPIASQARVVKGLTTVQVPVTDRTPAARTKAIRQGFAKVLVRVSGNPGIMTVPAVQEAADKLDDYVVSYGYQDDNLQVTYNSQAIDKLLKNTGQTVWKSNRPLTLVVISLRDHSKPVIVSSSMDNVVSIALRRIAEQRGVPIVLPEMDLQDQMDEVNTQALARRYGVSSMLRGNITRDDAQWSGQWEFLLDGEKLTWSNQGSNAIEMIKGAVNQMANLMANRLAVVPTNRAEQVVHIQVQGIEDLKDYAKVMTILRRLPPVAKVEVRDMSDAKLVLDVRTTGSEEELAAALGANVNLELIPMSMDSSDEKVDLAYRWLGSHSNHQPLETTQATPQANVTQPAPVNKPVDADAKMSTKTNSHAVVTQPVKPLPKAIPISPNVKTPLPSTPDSAQKPQKPKPVVTNSKKAKDKDKKNLQDKKAATKRWREDHMNSRIMRQQEILTNGNDTVVTPTANTSSSAKAETIPLKK